MKKPCGSFYSIDPYKQANCKKKKKGSADQDALELVQNKFSSVDFCTNNLIKC